MKVGPKVPPSSSSIPTSVRGDELRSKAQEKTDAAGGERIAGQQARKTAEAERLRYTDAIEARKQLLDDAKKLRLEAAEKLKGAVGARGLFALDNVARAFAALSKLTGKTFVTVEGLKADPDAAATSRRLEELASKKEAEAQALFGTAQRSWAASIEALSKAEGHERTAAAHTQAAAQLLVKAKHADQLAHTAAQIGGAVKRGFEHVAGAVSDVVKEEGRVLLDSAKQELGKLGADVRARARADLQGLLQVGIDFLKAAIERAFGVVEGTGKPDVKSDAKPAATGADPKTKTGGAPHKPVDVQPATPPPSPQTVKDAVQTAAPHLPDDAKAQLQDLGFTPGAVAFGSSTSSTPRAPIVVRGARPEEPPPGEKNISASFVGARWAAMALGVDFAGKGVTELKKLVEERGGGLKLSHGASPFEVKKRLSERLGLPTSKAAIERLDADAVRTMFTAREALGLPRLSTQTEMKRALEAAGLKADAGVDEIAMFAMAKGAQDVEAAKDALKAAPSDADKRAAFDKATARLDGAKRAILEVIAALPAGERRTLALDACDAVEVAHGKMGATTRLGAAIEALAGNRLFVDLVEKQTGAPFAATAKSALQASEWVSLGELSAPSGVLAFPGALTDAQRQEVIAPLAGNGVAMAKRLGLVDGDALAALSTHQRFDATPAGQLLGLARQLQALADKRDFRSKEQLSRADVLLELKRNAGIEPTIGRDGKPFIKSPPSLSPALVHNIDPLLDELLRALRR